MLLPAPAAHTAPLTARDVVDLARRAELAAAPPSDVQDWTIEHAGLRGTRHLIRRGDDTSETTREGPFETRSGTTGGIAWHQNENGYTILDAAPSQQPQVLATTLTAPAQAAGRYVVTETLASGVTQRTFYDSRDYVVLRREYARGGHVVALDYTDFRPGPGGRRIAWHERGSSERGTTFEATLVRDEAGAAVDAAALAVPPDRRRLVEFPPGVDQVRLPASVDFGRIHVRVDIDGRPLTFLLDSGASGIFINPQAARELGLASYGSQPVTVAGTFAFSRVIAPSIRIGDITLHDVVMGTAPLDGWETDKDRVVGLLGYDFIAGTALRITYGDALTPGSVDAIRPDVFEAPPLASAVMPVRLNQQVPVAHVGIGTAASDDFVVDTGAEAPIILFDRFVRAHPAAARDEGLGTGFDPEQSAVFGVGGRVRIVPLRLRSFRFADIDFRNFVVLRAANPGAFGDYRDDGLLGAFFLRYFTLYIDYGHAKLYFEPNDNQNNALGHSLP